MTEIEAYIRESAIRRGVDPDVAVRVAMSEGGLTNPIQQSGVVKNGVQETSYGPFQLRIGGGLGDEALARGIDPRNPEHWKRGVDFALEQAVKRGWAPWYGAAKAGIGNRQGLNIVSDTGTELAASREVPPTTSDGVPVAGTGPVQPGQGSSASDAYMAQMLAEKSDPFAGLASTLASGVKAASAQQQGGSFDGGTDPLPPVPAEFESALPPPSSAVTDFAATPALADLFQVGQIGQARVGNLDAMGQPIIRRQYG